MENNKLYLDDYDICGINPDKIKKAPFPYPYELYIDEYHREVLEIRESSRRRVEEVFLICDDEEFYISDEDKLFISEFEKYYPGDSYVYQDVSHLIKYTEPEEVLHMFDRRSFVFYPSYTDTYFDLCQNDPEYAKMFIEELIFYGTDKEHTPAFMHDGNGYLKALLRSPMKTIDAAYENYSEKLRSKLRKECLEEQKKREEEYKMKLEEKRNRRNAKRRANYQSKKGKGKL